MLRVTNSIEITETEFSPFRGQPLSSGIRNHLAGKLCWLFFFFLGTLWSDTTSRRRHDCCRWASCSSWPVLTRRRAGPQMTSSADVMSGRCALHVHQDRGVGFLWFSINQNMDPNPEWWLCWDPKFSLMPDKITLMLVKLIPIIGVTLLICEARIWLISYWTF